MKYNADTLTIHDHRVFAYGWAFDAAHAITHLELQLRLRDGTTVSLPVARDKERPDVAATFPDVPSARYGGWLAYGAWQGAELDVLCLAGRLDNGESFAHVLRDTPASAAARLAQGSTGVLRRLRAFRYRGGRELLRSARRWVLRALPALEDAGQSPLAAVAAALRHAGQDRLALVVDHAMGGGANVFSRAWLAAQLRRRPLALVLSFDIPSQRYVLDIARAEGERRRIVSVTEPATALAASGRVDEVLYNDAVSFPHPDLVPQWMVAFAAGGSRLTMAIHDYLSVCPSQFLLNDGGRFCGVPEMGECRRCLPRNENEFVRLYPAADMPAWRAGWGAALAAAERIVCFSDSSRRLLKRAHPGLPEDRVVVEPHTVQPFEELASVDTRAPLHVGVVGAIGWHKGAGVLQELAAEIARRGVPVRITVIGSLDAQVHPSVVTVTGGFRHDRLPAIVTESGANVFLLPSICPETFSYVTHELMQMRVPLVCFDFGAPADSVARYALGRVVPRTNAADLLDALLTFHSDIAQAHMVHA